MYIDSDVLIHELSSNLKGEVDMKLVCECIKVVAKFKGVQHLNNIA